MLTMPDFARPLDGLSTLVIGGGGEGIGRAISRAFAAAGASVGVADVDPDRARAAADELTASGARAVPLAGDVRSRSDVDGFVARTGVMAAPRQAGYGAAKAGLASLAKTVAAEYAADGIRMNVVACGAIATAVANADDSGALDIPLGRLGVPDDAAAAAVYLSSTLSSYVTGQSLVVDGGVTVRGPFPA